MQAIIDALNGQMLAFQQSKSGGPAGLPESVQRNHRHDRWSSPGRSSGRCPFCLTTPEYATQTRRFAVHQPSSTSPYPPPKALVVRLLVQASLFFFQLWGES